MKNENKEINNPVKTANNLHNAGFNCAQAVFAALAPEFGLDQATAVKIAATLGGGIARTGETCGAVTGALLTIGPPCAASCSAATCPHPKAWLKPGVATFSRRNVPCSYRMRSL
jgi:hypothetical protein